MSDQQSTLGNSHSTEYTLDPHDWSEFRLLGHQMLDDIIDHLSTLRDQPAWQQMPEQVKEAFTASVPYEPEGAEATYQDFVKNVLPYPNGNLHPRFFGWVQGNGTPVAMLADMLASALNPHLAGFNQAPALVEHQVLAWLTELMGMPMGTSGILCSGGTMANIVGLAVARHAKAGFDVRESGLQGAEQPRLLVYCSSETHSWAKRGMELLGFGNRALHHVPVDVAYRMDVEALRHSIAADRQAGYKPICVIANAGTVNTGVVDDLTAIAKVCEQEELWFHIDGAFGALARISPILQPLVSGIELADSLAFDLHKWMYLPFEVACVLVRNAQAHRDTFAMTASYLTSTSRGVIAGGLPFAERGFELTRGFKALKVWMSLKAHGVNAFAQVIEQNVRQAQYLSRLVTDHAQLELLAPAFLNIVCFRYAPSKVSEELLDSINQEVLLRIQESGVAVPSATNIHGRYAIRVAIANHRTQFQDIDALVALVATCGQEVVNSLSS